MVMILKIKTVAKRLLKKKHADNYQKYKMVNVGKFKLRTLSEDKIDTYLAGNPHYSVNFARMASWIFEQDDVATERLIIDVGANIGDTVSLLRSYGVQQPIISIEGDDTYFDLLTENTRQFTNVELIKSFLGGETGQIKGSLIINDGTGRIQKADDGQAIKIDTIDSLLASKKGIRILKIDTDGYDTAIIKGSRQMIAKQHPILFFEYYTALYENEVSCLQTLLALETSGYTQAIFYDNFGRMVMPIKLEDKCYLSFLDRYIKKNKGAFPYYDVAVFHQTDSGIAEKIIRREIALDN
jgi:FkbM family methyltransferase